MSHLTNYSLERTIGSGTFGKVRLAVHKATQLKVAVKILSRRKVRSEDLISRSKRACKFLKTFRNPHIIRLYEVIESSTHYYVVMEYVPNGDLYSLIEKKGRLSEPEARSYFQQLIAAVKYCHKRKVIHRDIKPENLLLDQNYKLKLGDFGLSGVSKDGEFMRTACGSPNYAAPEVISGTPYCGQEADVWSCGVMLFALLAGYLPFDENNLSTLFKKIKAAKFKVPYDISRQSKDLLHRMLNPDPVARISIEEIMAHPWFKPEFPSYLSSDFSEIKKLGWSMHPSIDQEVFEKTLEITGFKDLNVSHSVLRSRIADRKQDTFSVAYELLFDQQINRLLAEFKSSPGRPQLLSRFNSFHKKVNRKKLSDLEFDSTDEEEVSYSHPTDWVCGVPCFSGPRKLALNLYNALITSDLLWKNLEQMKLKVKNKLSTVKFVITVYSCQEAYTLDFCLKKGNPIEFFEICFTLRQSMPKVLETLSY